MSCARKSEKLVRSEVWAFCLSLIVLGWFSLGVEAFGPGRGQSMLGWLASAWNGENDFEHGWMTLPLILALLWLKREKLRKIPVKFSPAGMILVVAGVLVYLVAWRVIQPRIAVVSLPLMVSGAIWYLWGWGMARATAFPVYFILLAIPMPFFMHATVGLQVLATQGAHYGAMLFGVPTIVEGTTLLPANDAWHGFKIAEGCSGMRSLMALVMLSAAWAYLSPLAFWKQCVLFVASVPLAIVGNAVRITSIFVFASWFGPEFAGGTWHDWSGLLLFFPLSMFGLYVLQSLLSGQNPFQRKRRVVVRKVVAGSELERKETGE